MAVAVLLSPQDSNPVPPNCGGCMHTAVGYVRRFCRTSACTSSAHYPSSPLREPRSAVSLTVHPTGGRRARVLGQGDTCAGQAGGAREHAVRGGVRGTQQHGGSLSNAFHVCVGPEDGVRSRLLLWRPMPGLATCCQTCSVADEVAGGCHATGMQIHAGTQHLAVLVPSYLGHPARHAHDARLCWVLGCLVLYLA